MDLRDASHEEAVEAIRKAGNPVSFLVQSIVHRPRVSLQGWPHLSTPFTRPNVEAPTCAAAPPFHTLAVATCMLAHHLTPR